MDCSSIESVTQRLLEAYTVTLKTYFKKTNVVEATKHFLKGLAISVTPDPMTGEVSFELTTRQGNAPKLSEILTSITKLCTEKKTLLIFDEFQDIQVIQELLAVFRSHLQKLKTTPILFLGSKRKLLSKIFSSQQSPFFNFAEEHVLAPIALADWIPFFKERLAPIKTQITEEALALLCKEALDVPNAICEIGAFIQDYYKDQVIDSEAFLKILSSLIDRKSEAYRYQLSLLSANEINLCKALAQNRFTKSINGHEFLSLAKMGSSSATKVIKKLYHAGIVEEERHAYRISNPILSLFLKYRTY